MTVDRKCYQLAAQFLAEFPNSTGDNCRELAEDIQRVIEEFMARFYVKDKE